MALLHRALDHHVAVFDVDRMGVLIFASRRHCHVADTVVEQAGVCRALDRVFYHQAVSEADFFVNAEAVRTKIIIRRAAVIGADTAVVIEADHPFDLDVFEAK